MNTVSQLSRLMIPAGYIAMLVGAIDPMEGSLLILPGSGLVALGSFVGQGEKEFLIFRLWSLLLIAIGVTALWGLSIAGGFGGTSGLSAWWGILLVPYLIGWSIGVWGPGVPRWVPALGLGVGIWYLAIILMVLRKSANLEEADAAVFVIGATGVLTIAGCIYRLRAILKG
jgi:hypothetical protein